MNFGTDTQRVAYERIAVWLRQLYGESVRAEDQVPGFDVRVGPAIIRVIVESSERLGATVCLRAPVIMDVDTGYGLEQHLLGLNADAPIGGFLLTEDGDIAWQYRLPAAALEKPALNELITLAVEKADQGDEGIVSRWGGKRPTEE